MHRPFARRAILPTALLSTSCMTIFWAGFAWGNMPAAVQMTVVGLIAGSLLAPVFQKDLKPKFPPFSTLGFLLGRSYRCVSTEVGEAQCEGDGPVIRPSDMTLEGQVLGLWEERFNLKDSLQM
ncbi:MAG: hypothetical protein R6W86_11885 [Marinobacter sp.]|uniref:hypothetical protein n=1 Tax=Marinobacter sp. TaxID=50741 RepID=UPI00396EA9EA